MSMVGRPLRVGSDFGSRNDQLRVEEGEGIVRLSSTSLYMVGVIMKKLTIIGKGIDYHD